MRAANASSILWNPYGQKRANFPIADRFCRRHADRKAAARAILAAEIAGQSLAIQAPQHLAQRPIGGERFFHRDVAEFPVAPERGEIELALVAERAIEARPIHAGRCAQIVERGRCVAGAPEAFGGALQRDLRIVGARSPARPRLRSLWLFLYHFARNSLTRGTSSEQLFETVQKSMETAHGSVFLPTRLFDGHPHCAL